MEIWGILVLGEVFALIGLAVLVCVVHHRTSRLKTKVLVHVVSDSMFRGLVVIAVVGFTITSALKLYLLLPLTLAESFFALAPLVLCLVGGRYIFYCYKKYNKPHKSMGSDSDLSPRNTEKS